jgi:hypothetical protein
MSHVDEGTLHAYLDGELAPVERERVDVHLKGCPACQARLAEERAILERASRLLGLAAPPERAMPPLAQLRRPPVIWRLRRPLAWAATLILAVGLGWYVRGTFPSRAASQREVQADKALASQPASAAHALPAAGPVHDSSSLAMQPEGHLAMRRTVPRGDSINKDRDELQRQLEPAEVVTGAATGNAVAARDSTSVAPLGEQKVATAAQLPRAAAPSIRTRGAQSTVQPVAPAPEPQITIDGSLSRASLYGAEAARRATPVMSTTWPIIARQPARDVLGVEPAIIPGFAVRAYRRNPAAREIVVEQVTDAGTTISLIERRMDYLGYADSRADSAAANTPSAMAKAVNERLARFVGLLRVEIDGPLTPDSLSSLLELAR